MCNMNVCMNGYIYMYICYIYKKFIQLIKPIRQYKQCVIGNCN